MELLILVAVVIAAAWGISYIRKRKRGGSAGNRRLSRLYKECQKQLHLPPEIARENIDDFVSKMKAKYPGHSEEWYLEKILFDLKRDRR